MILDTKRNLKCMQFVDYTTFKVFENHYKIHI